MPCRGAVRARPRPPEEPHSRDLWRRCNGTACETFLAGKTLSASRIEFEHLLASDLTRTALWMRRYSRASPFIDPTPRGPEGRFTHEQVDALPAVREQVNRTAVAA